MKQPQIVFCPACIAGLLVMALFAWLVSCLYTLIPEPGEIPWFVHLIPALCLMSGAVIAHCLAKGRTGGYLLSYLLNATGSGCAIGALLGVGGVLPPSELLLALIPAGALALLLCLLLWIPSGTLRRVLAILFSILALALIGVGIYVWICRNALTGCALVFSGLFFLPIPICCGIAMDEPEQKYRYLSFAGFGAFLLIALVVALILSEGEILEGLDLGGEGKPKKKAKT